MGVTDLSEVGFFEGSEKLLEIWFTSEAADTNGESDNDLRNIPRFELDKFLDIVEAKIVSSTSNEYIHSYVLSESSMFISRHRIIVKTCGITKLLDAVHEIIKLANTYAHMPVLENFFYSRRIYLRPEEQKGPHKSFAGEVDYLDQLFGVRGSAFELGRAENERWYLYTLDNRSPGALASGDATLEILMSDLDEDIMRQFTTSMFTSAQDMTTATGINGIIPGSIYDGLIFEPVGYSMNGLFNDSYHTIHVTPQPLCSYVSFETNLPKVNYNDVINNVLKVFRPTKFIVSLISNQNAPCGPANSATRDLHLQGYERRDHQLEQSRNYSIAYEYYVRIDV